MAVGPCKDIVWTNPTFCVVRCQRHPGLVVRSEAMIPSLYFVLTNADSGIVCHYLSEPFVSEEGILYSSFRPLGATFLTQIVIHHYIVFHFPSVQQGIALWEYTDELLKRD